jgi:hypothetical protein
VARRIGRGLFRLWVVASVVWVCTVGAVTWSIMPEKKPPFDPSKPYEEFVPDSAPEPPSKPGMFDDLVRDAERNTVVQHAAETALIPPVLVLVLGVALGWAVKGFRANEPRK